MKIDLGKFYFKKREESISLSESEWEKLRVDKEKLEKNLKNNQKTKKYKGVKE